MQTTDQLYYLLLRQRKWYVSMLPIYRELHCKKGDNVGLCHPTLKDSWVLIIWTANNLIHGPGFVLKADIFKIEDLGP